jgi:protein-disulfide isomerase
MTEECEKCGKSFKSEEALEQHRQDYDHSEEEDKEISLKQRFMDSQLAGISLIGVLILGTGFLFVSAVSSSADNSAGSSELIDTGGEPYLGSENASVTIAYFGDYNCSACLYFEQNIFSDMQGEIIGEDVKFVKKNFPVINDQSPQLAQASESVWSQTNSSNREVFWEWHANMYDNQGSYTSNWATVDRIVELSSEVEGVDAEQVREDIESGKFRSETRGDLSEGQSSGVSGTPTFIVFSSETGESRKLVGPQPLTQFRTAINGVSS